MGQYVINSITTSDRSVIILYSAFLCFSCPKFSTAWCVIVGHAGCLRMEVDRGVLPQLLWTIGSRNLAGKCLFILCAPCGVKWWLRLLGLIQFVGNNSYSFCVFTRLSPLSSHSMGVPRPGAPRHNIIPNRVYFEIFMPIIQLYGNKSKTCRPVFRPYGYLYR